MRFLRNAFVVFTILILAAVGWFFTLPKFDLFAGHPKLAGMDLQPGQTFSPLDPYASEKFRGVTVIMQAGFLCLYSDEPATLAKLRELLQFKFGPADTTGDGMYIQIRRDGEVVWDGNFVEGEGMQSQTYGYTHAADGQEKEMPAIHLLNKWCRFPFNFSR